jgi:hypothetical protein
MTSNGTPKDGCDERHDVQFRKRWRCLLRVKRHRIEPTVDPSTSAFFRLRPESCAATKCRDVHPFERHD